MLPADCTVEAFLEAECQRMLQRVQVVGWYAWYFFDDMVDHHRAMRNSRPTRCKSSGTSPSRSCLGNNDG